MDEGGRTPTPDSQTNTRATMTPTPTFSDGVDLETSELEDHAGAEDLALDHEGPETAASAEDELSVEGRSSAHREEEAASQVAPEEPEPEDEEPEVSKRQLAKTPLV